MAIKLLRGEITAASGLRFVSEAKLLARLEHPAIARLIDVGVSNGEGWIALELVLGRPIDEYCETLGLDIRERVKLLNVVADAVATAHRMLVVHRDIKPTNVLVTEDGRPKLIDFGIAAALGLTTQAREPTADIRRLFTPNYAAPEQVSGDPVTVATDVFGLGALAYRLLSGRAPFAQATSPVGYLLAVTQQDVAAPSRAAVAAGKDQTLAGKLRGDLDAILMKALERDPARRYPGAQDLQADLQRYLDGLPVNARAPSVRYRAVKFARRHALALSLGTLLSLGVIVGGVIYGFQARSVAQARNAAVRRGEILARLFSSADPRLGGGDPTVAQLIDTLDLQIDTLTEKDPLFAASMLGLVAKTNRGLGRYPKGLAASTRELELLRMHGGAILDLADALILRGLLLKLMERQHEAEAPLREALALVEHRPGAEKQLGGALVGLGAVFHDLGREQEAESMYERGIDVYRKAGKEFTASLIEPLADMGVLRHDQGRYHEAVAYLRESVEIARKVLPRDHPDLLDTEYNYAGALEHDHPSEAEPVFRDLLASYQRMLGPQHIDTLMAQQGLAQNLLVQRRYQEAAAVALPAAEGLARVAGEDHSWTLLSWSVYGSATCLGGDGETGLRALRHVAAVHHQASAVSNRTSLATDVRIGTCLVALRRYGEAEPLLLKAVASLEIDRGSTYSHTQAGYRALRDLYAGTGRAEQAAIWQAKILPADQ